jgi:hypothetical protein
MATGKTCRTDGCENPARADGAKCGKCHKAGWRERLEARRDPAEHDYGTEQVPEGFHLSGLSELRGADGEVKLRWIKSAADAETRALQLRDAILQIGEEMPRAKKAKAPRGTDDDLLCIYPIGDPHIGMHAWGKETGQDFDIKIAEQNLIAAVDALVELAPPAKHALVINLGDFFHADSSAATTTRGTRVDVDTRWAKVLAVGVRIMRRIIDRALEQHEHVTVICEIGNHDDQSSQMLALCLEQYYEREPRVTVDTSPSKFHWYRFGRNLIGTTHGDTVKFRDLPALMACDRPQDWGETEHRYWYVGHVHHDSLMTLQGKEHPGAIVETFRTLAPKDAWHAGQGYRAGQDLKLDVIHREDGRHNRHVVGIRQVFRRLGKEK